MRQISSDESLQVYKGYIVNRMEHWFCLREISGIWWNLNSMNSKPELVSAFQLSAFLAALMTVSFRF